MSVKNDRLMVVGCLGLVIMLGGIVCGERGAALAMVGLIGTVLAAGAAIWRAVGG